MRIFRAAQIPSESGDSNTFTGEVIRTTLAGDTVGKTVKAAIVRGGEPTEVSIVVGERPGRP